MSRTQPSRHAHGRSEIWTRGATARAIAKERLLLGKRLRALREERSWTQERAAERIGIHAKHLQRVELGTANVTIATLVATARAYRVHLASLFDRS